MVKVSTPAFAAKLAGWRRCQRKIQKNFVGNHGHVASRADFVQPSISPALTKCPWDYWD